MKNSTTSDRPINGAKFSGEFYSCLKKGVVVLEEGIDLSSSSSTVVRLSTSSLSSISTSSSSSSSSSLSSLTETPI